MDDTTFHIAASSWMEKAPFPWLGGHEAVYLILCFGVSVYLISRAFTKAGDKWPVLNPVGFEIIGLKRRMEFAQSASNLLEKGRQMFPQQPYHMNTDTCDLVILPPKFADGIRNNPDLSFTTSIVEDFHATVPGFQPFLDGREDDLTRAVVKKQLTKLLSTK